MNDLPDVLTRLEARLQTLEGRVDALEHPATAARELSALQPELAPAAIQEVEPAPTLTSGLLPVLGEAMLGIAGAYLLRAVAESGSLPNTAVAVVAIAYALGWLVWASRARAGDWIAGTTYACTSALILAPMLWELTLRFQVLPAWVTAAVMCSFVLAASALAWKHDFAPVLWVANGMAVVLALTLAISSHQVTPFIAVLLLMVLVSEYAAERDHPSGVRVLVAFAADVAVWAEIYIYSGQQSARASYPSLGAVALIAPGITLFTIFAVSLIYKTVLKRKAISAFETFEIMIAFLLAACGLLYFGPPSGTVVLGILCFALSAAGYAAAFVLFDPAAERRNYLVSANWSAALLLAGCLLCLPHIAQVLFLTVAAVAATVAGVRLARFEMELQGMVFLLAAAWVSGLWSQLSGALASSLPGVPGLSVNLVSVGAVLCYAVIKPSEARPWTRNVLSIVLAAVAIAAVAALAVQGLAALTALKVALEAHHLAFIRAFIASVAAISLAYSGAHWRRMELTRIGYATLALLALKLIFEDLRHGHLAFIAGSIFLFAVTLMAMPRVARIGQKV